MNNDTIKEILFNIMLAGKYAKHSITSKSKFRLIDVSISRGRTATISLETIKDKEGFCILSSHNSTANYVIRDLPTPILNIKIQHLLSLRDSCFKTAIRTEGNVNINVTEDMLSHNFIKHLKEKHPNDVYGDTVSDLLKMFSLSLKLTNLHNDVIKVNEFTSKDMEDCFRMRETHISGDGGMSFVNVNNYSMFLAYILPVTKNEICIMDLGELYDTGELDVADIVEIIRSSFTWRSKTVRLQPIDYINKRDEANQLEAARQADAVSQDMRRLSRAVDLQSDGKIKIKRNDIIEELAMINKLIQLIGGIGNGSRSLNDIDKLRSELAYLYDGEGVEYTIANEGNYICINGKLFLKSGDGCWLKLASVNRNVLSLEYPEDVFRLLASDYSERAVRDNLATFIAVNDLAQRY